MPAFIRRERIRKNGGMRIRHFMGRPLPFAERAHLPGPEQMQLGGLLLGPSAKQGSARTPRGARFLLQFPV